MNGGPDYDGINKLSIENAMLLEICKRAKSPGYKLPDHLDGDPLFAECYAIVEQITNDAQRESDNESLAHSIAKIMIGKG